MPHTPNPNMSTLVTTQLVPAGLVCHITCSKVMSQEAQVIEQDIRAAAHDVPSTAKHWRVVVDLAGVTMLASMGLGMLVNLHKACANEGGKLVICNMAPELLSLLQITHLEKVLKVVPDREAAIKALA